MFSHWMLCVVSFWFAPTIQLEPENNLSFLGLANDNSINWKQNV